MAAPDAWTPVELDITRDLVSWRRQFVTRERKVDTKSEKGYMVVQNYLQCLSGAFQVFEVDPASRHYRQSFSPKYQSIWPGQSRLFRVDVLEASIQQMLWMNGRWFELSPTAVELAGRMRHEWAELGRLLKRLNEAQLAALPWDTGLKAEMRSALEALDVAWANFEHACVLEAMTIEDQARALLAEACGRERALSEACRRRGGGGQPGGAEARRERLGELVRLLGELREAACPEGEARPVDWRLVTRALLGAKAILGSVRPQKHHQKPDLAHALATRANDAFEAVRDYLCNVPHWWESVDGQLANNPGLVARLTHFGESLCATARYLADPRLLHGLSGTAAFLSAACAAAPKLATMGAEYDPEFFLVLPKIVWLGFLSAPDQTCPLIEHALPELFPQPQVRGPELQALINTHCQTVEELATATGDCRPADAHKHATDVLVQRAVVGIGQECEGPFRRHSCGSPGRAAGAEAEAFLRHLDGWSMRLQRQHPEDWNELAAILLGHLFGDAGEGRDAYGYEEPRGFVL